MSATWLVGQNFNWAKRKCYSTTKKISPLGGAGKKKTFSWKKKRGAVVVYFWYSTRCKT